MKKILLLAVLMNLLIATRTFAQTSAVSQSTASSSDDFSSVLANAPFRNPSLPITERVADLVSRMSQDQEAAAFLCCPANCTICPTFSSSIIGIGARIKVVTKGGVQYNHMTTSVGHASSSDGPVHFGLGSDSRAEEIEIHWPSGVVQTLRGVDADRRVEVTEPDSKK